MIEGFVFSSQNFPAHWADLDAFEGAEYQRVVTAVTLADGTLIEANVYALR